METILTKISDIESVLQKSAKEKLVSRNDP